MKLLNLTQRILHWGHYWGHLKISQSLSLAINRIQQSVWFPLSHQ